MQEKQEDMCSYKHVTRQAECRLGLLECGTHLTKIFVIQFIYLPLFFPHTHTHMYVCVCVCVCIYIYTHMLAHNLIPPHSLFHTFSV